MADEQAGVLVIESTDGTRYAIPSDILEQFKLPEGTTVGAAEPEVEGFGWGWNWNYWWTPPNRLIGLDGGTLIGTDSAGFRNRYW